MGTQLMRIGDIAELAALRNTLRRALARSRALPVAGSCVCGIIEAQELSVRQPEPRRGHRRANQSKKQVRVG